MDYSKRYDLKTDKKNLILRSGQSASYKINGDAINKDNLHRLFFTCENTITPMSKHESGAELSFMHIDDSLNHKEAEQNRYCLDLSCSRPYPFAKRCMKKVVWQPLSYGVISYSSLTEYKNEWRLSISAKAENLKIEEGGYLRLRIERWATKDNVNPHDTTAEPDETIVIDIPEGTYPYTVFSKELCIEQDTTACVIVTLEGENYSGNVYFENPFLKDGDDRNLLPEFERGSLGLERFAWMGQNLTKREWPKFKVSVNDKVIFDDEVFQRLHRFSVVEIPLPEGCFTSGENTVSITYTSDYIDAIPLSFDEIALFEKEKVPFSLVRCPEEVTYGDSVRILVETEVPDCKLSFESDDFVQEEVTSFSEFNLQVLSIKPTKKRNNLKFKLACGDKAEVYTIKRCVEKENDNVLCGSGDMMYIDISDKNAVIDFMKWYVSNDIGNFITIRPIYRWGGQRSVNLEVWKVFTKFCEKMNIKYVNLSDGRDIPGLDTNPSYEMLKGENFLGFQLHERDGQLIYWPCSPGHPHEIASPYEEYYDLAARLAREHPDTIEGSYRTFNIQWGEHGYSYKRVKSKNADMKESHDIVANELHALSDDNFTRHTGPSVMFKYFYQNGFKWTGFESMYGATEIPLAFLRGASSAYGIKKYGAHLALQWGVFPLDTEQKYKRYLLSLYVPYMHGVTDINTEEGLWFLEARYAHHNYLSEPCKKHREEVNRFNKFTRTHSRTGEFYTPIAFLHGRMDGWNGFSARTNWGMPNMKTGDEATSWSLLKLFYPLNAIGRTGCYSVERIPEGYDKPFGRFSGTPMGNVDAIPVEHGELSGYRALIFAGYNKAEDSDLDRLEKYVANGGTLMCTWAHLSDTTLSSDIESYNLNIAEHPLISLLSDGKASFVSDSVEGKEIKICENPVANCEIIETTDSGKPLVYSVKHGDGEIILVNTLYYPGNEAVMPVYERCVTTLSKRILDDEPIKVECGEDVQYTIFNQEDGTRHYYFTAVDWYNSLVGNRSAGIAFDGNTYGLDVPFGQIVKLVTNGKTAVWPEDDSAEVISLNDNSFVAQGFGMQKFYIARGGKVDVCTVDFSDNCVQICKL